MTEAGWNGKTTAAMRRLGIALPVVQGPFGGGASTVERAAAVCERGGLGSFGAHMLAPAEIAGTCAAIRARTAMPFALNLRHRNVAALMQALCESAQSESTPVA